MHKQHFRRLGGLSCSILLGWGLVALPIAYAQGQPQLGEALVSNINVMMGWLTTVLNLATFVCFALLNFLLDPTFFLDLGGIILNNGGTSLETMLNEIWQLARDLVNLFFALALIGVAIYTTVTANKEVIHQHAAKFVMAVVLVNFSWFIPRVILDVSNILTSTVYGIPSLILDSESNPTGACKQILSEPAPSNLACKSVGNSMLECNCTTITDIRFLPTTKEIRELAGQGYNCELRFLCYSEAVLDMSTVTGHSVMLNGLIVNFARLKSFATTAPMLDVTWKLEMQTIRQALILLIQVAMFFPLAAMTAAFFLRIPILWLTISFMPFVFVGWVLDDKFTQGYPKKIMDTFIKAALMPAVVALPLAIGFILINAGQQIATAQVLNPLVGQFMNINFRLIEGVSSLWQIAWLLMSLMVMYTGVFAALRVVQFDQELGGEFMGRTVQRIQDMGRFVLPQVAKIPLSLPIIPGAGAGGGKGSAADAIGKVAPGIADRLRPRLPGFQPQTPPGGGGLSPAQLQQAAAAAAAANRPGATVSPQQLRDAVRLAGSGSDGDLRRLQQTLNQLNPNLHAERMSREQVVTALRHIESGAHGNRIRVDIETHAPGISGAAARPAPANQPAPNPPANPGGGAPPAPNPAV
ncbi:MAG: Uncharacterized protein G01um101425_607 [Candidatus Peregrinibacteria bacterium Gr01-1014_25]|nr:MAG: Uncharacterized protein G01um101425_607 [Candidatus Peregrinibacteria bacterium Gr01-1014_25]